MARHSMAGIAQTSTARHTAVARNGHGTARHGRSQPLGRGSRGETGSRICMRSHGRLGTRTMRITRTPIYAQGVIQPASWSCVVCCESGGDHMCPPRSPICAIPTVRIVDGELTPDKKGNTRISRRGILSRADSYRDHWPSTTDSYTDATVQPAPRV